MHLRRDHDALDWKSTVKYTLLGNRLHERAVRTKLQTVRSNVFWDIGANIGFYSLWLRKNFQKIIAVEPNPQTAYTLRKRINFSLARNIEVRQLALSNHRGWAPFYSQREWYSGPGIGNLIAGIGNLYTVDSLLSKFEYKSATNTSGSLDRVRENRPSFQVWTERFDDLNTKPVDLVKIDVEGAEFLVLEGMKESLASQRVRNILVELHDRDRKAELEAILNSNFSHVFWVDPQHLYGFRDAVILPKLKPGPVTRTPSPRKMD